MLQKAKSLIKYIVIQFMMGLRVLLGDYGCCRLTPSCTQYAKQSIENHSALKATWLIIKRLLKCQPFFNPNAKDEKNALSDVHK